jgi:hypothetical protein
MGHRVDLPHGTRRLIPALEALAKNGRPLLVVFDAERKEKTARKVGKSAGTLATLLRAAGGKPSIARLPLLPGAEKTGLDDLWVAGGPEALDAALANTSPRPVLPYLRPADRIAPAGQWLGEACPIPSPEEAPLVVISAPMGAGKTRAVEDALTPLQLEGMPILLPSHRRNLGQALSGRVGVPWEAPPGTDERLQGVSGCLDSWCPDSRLQITGETGSGGVLVLDEWMQQAEHLLLGSGTALTDRTAPRRASVLRTLGEQLPRARQVVAADGQMAQWGVDLLEALTGRQALLISSEHQPMAGRPLHAPQGFTTPQKAAEAFRGQWGEQLFRLQVGDSLMVWTSAQKGNESSNAAENLADYHRKIRPADLLDVIDSTTPALAVELAADPDGFVSRRIAQAAAQGGAYALYPSPAISSGISFEHWKPNAVLAYSGGHIAPEHVVQALARVRCPDVPAWLFAPEQAPLIRVGSGATDPAELIAHLRGAADPLLGALQESGAEQAYLKAYGEHGAVRNRQSYAYSATTTGLMEREGWELQAPGPEPCPALVAAITAELCAIRDAKQEAKQEAILSAEPLTEAEASALGRRRQKTPSEAAALDRHKLSQRWALADAPLSLELLEADQEGLAARLRMGWLLSTPEALALVPTHDWLSIARLDSRGRPFAPDRLKETIAPTIAALQALGLPELLERFSKGETIAATDPALLALHANATTHHRHLKTAVGISPGKLPTGTLKNLLHAVGWELQRVGRIKARKEGDRDAYIYKAERVALPNGVDPEALAALWLAELREGGAKNNPIKKTHRVKKSPNTSPAFLQRWPLAPVVAIPWPSGPPRAPSRGFATACRPF